MADLERLQFLMGRVEHFAGCSIVTKFRAINIIPYEAIQSYLEVPGQQILIARHPRSVTAAYLRVWVTVAACLSFVALLVDPFLVVIPWAMVVLTGYCWFFFGQLSALEKRQRLAYALWLEAPIDPAVLEPNWSSRGLESLQSFLFDRSAALATDGQPQPPEPWRTIALQSSDPEYLIAVLTWTRFARRGTSKAEQKSLDSLHSTIWSKLDPILSMNRGPVAYGEWQRHAEEIERKSARMTPRIAGMLVLGLGLLALAGIPVLGHFMQPRAAIVNTTGFDGLTVLLDGKPLVVNLPQAHREKDAGFFLTRLTPGSHEFIARDAAGHEIDRQMFVLEPKKRFSVVYAPARRGESCFYQERMTYAEQAERRDYDLIKLDQTQSLHILTMVVDDWFEAPPAKVETSNQRPTIERFSVRALPCDFKPQRAPLR